MVCLAYVYGYYHGPGPDVDEPEYQNTAQARGSLCRYATFGWVVTLHRQHNLPMASRSAIPKATGRSGYWK